MSKSLFDSDLSDLPTEIQRLASRSIHKPRHDTKTYSLLEQVTYILEVAKQSRIQHLDLTQLMVALYRHFKVTHKTRSAFSSMLANAARLPDSRIERIDGKKGVYKLKGNQL
jgi:hypothetical protein